MDLLFEPPCRYVTLRPRMCIWPPAEYTTEGYRFNRLRIVLAGCLTT